MSAATGPGLQTEVQSAALTPSEVIDAARDPAVLGVAVEMPVRLIEPVSAQPEAEAGNAAPTWGIKAVGADASAFTGQSATVAILDTGIDGSHPAFAGVNLVQQDFTGSGNGDQNGHGTHCAATILGRDVSGTRIGIARGVTTALIGKVLDAQGRGSSDALFRAMKWASDSGAQVISMSIGFDFPGMVDHMIQRGMPNAAAASAALVAYRGNLRMFDAIMAELKASAFMRPGCVVVAAAGNESQAPAYRIAVSLPAAADGVIAVGAIQQGQNGFEIAPFSNTMPQVAAPGVSVTSAKAGGGLQALSGTSMATPHVAGVAALWWDAIKSLGLPNTANTVGSKLLASARPNVFATGVDIADRGGGLVTAP